MWDDLKKDYDACLDNLKIIKSKYPQLLVKISDLKLKKMPVEVDNTDSSQTINIIYKSDHPQKLSPSGLDISSPPGLDISSPPGLDISSPPGLDILLTPPGLDILLTPPGLDILSPPGLNISHTPGLNIFEYNTSNDLLKVKSASKLSNGLLFNSVSNGESLLGLSYDNPSTNKNFINSSSHYDLSFESELLRNRYHQATLSTPQQIPSMQYQQPSTQYQQPSMQYQQPSVHYQQPSMQYQQQIPGVHNQQQIPTTQYQQQIPNTQYIQPVSMNSSQLNLNAPSYEPVVQPMTISSFQKELSKLDSNQLDFLLNKIKETRDQKNYNPSLSLF
jgi:hypothetical protein